MLNKTCALIAVFFMLTLFSCVSKKDAAVLVLVKAKCVYNSGRMAKFESNSQNYSQIVIQENVKSYVVGNFYYLEFRKK